MYHILLIQNLIIKENLRVDLVKLQIVVLEFSVDVKSAVMFMFLSFVSAVARNVWLQMAK